MRELIEDILGAAALFGLLYMLMVAAGVMG